MKGSCGIASSQALVGKACSASATSVSTSSTSHSLWATARLALFMP